MEWKYRLIRAGLHTAVIYRLAELGVRLVDKGYRKQALLYLLEETRAAYKHRRPVVWCSTFVPSELVYALGGVPFMPEVAAGFSAAAGLGDELITRAEGDWLNPDLCSIHRSGTGLKKAGLLPEPDLMIASTHLCDGAQKYLQQLAREYDCPFYLLETPYNTGGRDWLARQIREISGEISQGTPDFEQAFNLSNRAYNYHQQVNQLRRRKPAFLSGEQSMNLVPMEFMSFGSPGGVEYYRALLEELKQRQEKGQPVVNQEKIRLLWLHLKPYYPQQLFSLLHSKGAVVAFEEYFQLYWDPLDPEQPYRSLADKMINHFGWGPLSDQIQAIIDLVEEYQLDGVVGFSQWGCRQNSGRLGKIKRTLKARGIPFLKLDGDLVDSRDYREGQLKTRLEAFLELIEQQSLSAIEQL